MTDISQNPAANSVKGNPKDIEAKLDEIVLKPAQWQYDYYQKAKAALQTLLAEAERKARIDELRNLIEYNGAYIGMDGKRVDNMVSHIFIRDRIAELKTPHKEGGDHE